MVCTLGPTSNSPEGIRALAKAGMNVARLNFSHGTVQSQQEVLQRVKAVNAEGEVRRVVPKGPLGQYTLAVDAPLPPAPLNLEELAGA